MSKFMDSNQRDWDEHLPFLLMAYRSATHETTGYSPVQMMLGRELKLPIDLLFGWQEKEPVQAAVEYTRTLSEFTNLLELNYRKYDTLLECSSLEAGDAAWLHNPQYEEGLSPKLQWPWEGPFSIIKKINDSVYRIQLGPKSKPKVVQIF